MTKLYCDLYPFGWNLVRRGWRKGLPKNKPPLWVFCPRLTAPRDRRLVEDCKKCDHFKEIIESKRGLDPKEITAWKPKIQKRQRQKRGTEQHVPTNEEFNKDIKKQLKEKAEWEEEEAKRQANGI